MNKENSVYVIAMLDSLKSKYEVLQKILNATKRQETLVSGEEIDLEAFDELMDEKDILIRQIQELDQGFQGIYEKEKSDLEQNKQVYKPRILEMQNLLRQITDLGVKIQALEQKNKTKFETLVAKKKQEIQGFRLNNKTASVYTQHMANQHQEGQSYFLDKKK